MCDSGGLGAGWWGGTADGSIPLSRHGMKCGDGMMMK